MSPWCHLNWCVCPRSHGCMAEHQAGKKKRFHYELFMSHMMHVILGTEHVSSSHNIKDKRHGGQCDDTSSQEWLPQHCEKERPLQPQFLQIPCSESLRRTASSTQPINSHAMDAVTTSTHSFVVVSVFLFRFELRCVFRFTRRKGLDRTHHAQFCQRFRRESENSARGMECGLSLKSLSRPRIRVFCRWSCGQCCVRGSVFLLSRATWPQTRQAQPSSLHQVLGWHVSQWWQVIADFTHQTFPFSRVHNSPAQRRCTPCFCSRQFDGTECSDDTRTTF